MLFSSIPFLYYFLPITVILYLVVPKRFKNLILLIASLTFYAWGEKKLVLLFGATIIIGWILGLLIEKFHETNLRKVFMLISLIVDLGLLGYFKYADFFISNINSATGLAIPLLRIAMPIGISFYTFQILSYTIDVYRGDTPAQRNIINFATYVSLFPQLIAGPIVRYKDVAYQLNNRTHSLEKVSDGVRRFLLGLGKKILIANVLSEVIVLMRATTEPTVLYYWMYAICFTLQIYFDFSGYSDMAIGLGKMFGFEFLENFRFPYISKTITEFWRRWHISLGSWFRDYVYIPLGGNKKGIARQIINILIVWLLTGFWHGASWNFILWGLFYAVLLILEKLFLKKFFEKFSVPGHIYVLLAVILGFVLFNGDSLAQVGSDIAGMFAFGKLPLTSAESLYYLRSFAPVIIMGIIGATPLPRLIVSKIDKTKVGSKALTVLEPIFLIGILLIATAFLVDGSFNPFLYFRF